MKVVIPMAGRGTRLRPHTLTLPKPLMKIAGKSMIEWIVDEIKQSSDTPVDEVHFIIGNFGEHIEKMLIDTAEKIGATGHIHYQLEALGTGHALYCARKALQDEVFVVFADTIFKGSIAIDKNVDGIIWTMNVDEPEKYGVVKTDADNIITDFIEKPKELVSNNAIVGLYYFKEAQKLRKELDLLIENDARENNEYQLTNCLESLKDNGDKLKCAALNEWLDCGNKQELLATHGRILEIEFPEKTIYVANSAKVDNTKIGKHVSIGEDVHIINSKIENSIIYPGAIIKDSTITNSIIGHHCVVEGLDGSVFLGDYSEYAKA
ncbi:MAG TPA: nucleotidyltransferase [Bacteroidales bacterium]|jgi:glucose-1-phosphate thymidylyltransferase|nr:nucleotidyltransferase [Bacteroidales bacterium]